MKLSPTFLAAASSAGMFASGSLAWRRLKTALNPIFLISVSASGVVAPPQAMVVSRRVKLVMPATCCLVTCCADRAVPRARVMSAKKMCFIGGSYRSPMRLADFPERRRPVEGTRVERNPLPAGIRIERRYGAEQRARIWMLRRSKQGRGVAHFHDLSEIHYRDPIADVLDEPQVVRDEEE